MVALVWLVDEGVCLSSAGITPEDSALASARIPPEDSAPASAVFSPEVSVPTGLLRDLNSISTESNSGDRSTVSILLSVRSTLTHSAKDLIIACDLESLQTSSIPSVDTNILSYLPTLPLQWVEKK